GVAVGDAVLGPGAEARQFDAKRTLAGGAACDEGAGENAEAPLAAAGHAVLDDRVVPQAYAAAVVGEDQVRHPGAGAPNTHVVVHAAVAPRGDRAVRDGEVVLVAGVDAGEEARGAGEGESAQVDGDVVRRDEDAVLVGHPGDIAGQVVRARLG